MQSIGGTLFLEDIMKQSEIKIGKDYYKSFDGCRVRTRSVYKAWTDATGRAMVTYHAARGENYCSLKTFPRWATEEVK